MKTADLEQIHSFWITIWIYLTNFRYVLSVEEIQKALTSLNQPKKHPFWHKLKEALWTLVSVPKEKTSMGFRSGLQNIDAISTNDWLEDQSLIDIPADLREKLALKQPDTFGGTGYVRIMYDTNDFSVLGNISRVFPGLAHTYFDQKEEEESRFSVCTLPRIAQFVKEADKEDMAWDAICDPESENIFFVWGRKGPFLVSVRRKLGKWRMTRVQAGDNFRGSCVYIFV